MTKQQRLCPPEKAGSLDSVLRRLIHNPRRILKDHVKEGMIVLDVGCGPGFFSKEIAKMVGPSGQVISADLQEGMLQKLKVKIKGTDIEKRIKLHKCEESKIGVKEKVDFVLAFYMVHEVLSQENFFKEIKSILKPKGRVFIIEPRFHVSKKAFKETIDIATKAGLKPAEKKRVFFSRAIVLEKK